MKSLLSALTLIHYNKKKGKSKQRNSLGPENGGAEAQAAQEGG
jgi:hypothetical protein